MSLVWTLIASFLYAEIFVVLLLVLPVASPYKWNRFFKSKFLAMLRAQAHVYFILILGVLVLFLLEAIREMRKYSSHPEGGDVHLNVEMQHSMRLFRAQRNFYISGFSIFLVLVIRRLVTLISAQAGLLAQSEASMKQAQSATAAARTFMTDKSTDKAKEATEDKTLGEVSVKQIYSSDFLWRICTKLLFFFRFCLFCCRENNIRKCSKLQERRKPCFF